MQSKDLGCQYDDYNWWDDPLTINDRKDIDYAWIFCLDTDKVEVGPNASVTANLGQILTYLRETKEEIYAPKMKMKYGAEQVKYKQMYDKLYYLTKGKPVAQANAKPSVPKIQVLEDD